MNVLFISTEALPFAKSGGLGDVIGTLPRELVRKGVDARVIMPLYKPTKEKYQKQLNKVCEIETHVAWRVKYCALYELEYESVIFYFIDNEEYFGRDRYYGFYDDGERFAYFCRAVLDLLRYIPKYKPDILHCNEWQTALVPIYLKTIYRKQVEYVNLRTVFTIHNIEYQGQYDKAILGDLFGIDQSDYSLVELEGCINLLKGAVVTCDKLTTVSPSYAEEIQYDFFGRGLEGIIRENSYKLCGILNGIDGREFNPWFDKHLKARYSAKSSDKKLVNKLALQEQMGLDANPEIPVIGMITRLVSHKGIDLLINVFDELMEENIQMVILGSGEKQYEDFFNTKVKQYPDKMAIYMGFGSELPNRIYAGADMFLMPSISEPCGLVQMICTKYGTIPIVRATGGLKDSIVSYNPQEKTGNGITFLQVNAQDMLGAVKRAISLYWDKLEWDTLMQNAFASDFSWKRSAGEYISVYQSLV